MGWTHIAVVKGTAGSGTTVNASSTLNVQTGDLLVASAHWQGAATGDNPQVDEAGNTDGFTLIANTFIVQGFDFGGSIHYLIATGNNAAFTPRFTIGAAGIELDIIVRQFRPDGGDTVSLDTSNGAGGSSTSLASGTITTAGTDEVVVGAGGQGTGTSITSEQINSVAADGATDSTSNYYSNWYRILTATFAGGQATATAGGGAANWVCAIAAFKAEPAGGGGGGSTLWARGMV